MEKVPPCNRPVIVKGGASCEKDTPWSFISLSNGSSGRSGRRPLASTFTVSQIEADTGKSKRKVVPDSWGNTCPVVGAGLGVT